MPSERPRRLRIEDYLGCFGQFRSYSPICHRWCAQNLRCAIERDQKARLELLEEMISIENQIGRIQ